MIKNLVSVIIPTIPERKKYLDSALESVGKQTYPNVETIVINNPDISAPEARNEGIKMSNGEFIALMDDDNGWKHQKLKKQVSVMNKNPDCPLVICWSNDLRFGQDRINKPPSVITHSMVIKSFNLSSSSSYLIRRSFLDKEPFDTSLDSAQEYDLAIRLSKHGDIRCVQEVLMTQNATLGQISENWNRKISGIKTIAKKYKDEYSFKDKLKTFGVVNLFRVAKLPGVGNRIYKIIIPIKRRYEGGN